jgi:hypothetical protein
MMPNGQARYPEVKIVKEITSTEGRAMNLGVYKLSDVALGDTIIMY